MNKRVGFGIAAVAIIIAIIAFVFWPQGGGTNHVRVAANLTLSGPLATYGQAAQRGAEMAAEDLRKSDLNGPGFEFDWQDNTGSPQTAVTIMQRQYLNPPDVYTSGVAPQSAAIRKQISARGTPHFLWVFEIRMNEGTTNNLRTWVNFKIEPELYLAYIDKYKPKRSALVYPNVEVYSAEVNTLIVPGLQKRGIKDDNLFVESYPFETSDFKAIVSKIVSFKPDLLILQGYQTHMIGLVRALRPLGLIKEGNTLANYDMMDASVILGPDEVEGIHVTAPYFVTRPDRTETSQWRARFTAKYDRPPLYTDAFAYDMVTIIHDAAKRLQLPATPEQWVAALRKTDIPGITGPLKFDDDGSLITPIELGVFRKGKLVPLEQ